MSKQLTGEQVHAAYNEVLRADMKERGAKYESSTIRLWSDLSKREKYLYDGLAKYLNELLAQQEASKP
jgi:hypothetical protein